MMGMAKRIVKLKISSVGHKQRLNRECMHAREIRIKISLWKDSTIIIVHVALVAWS